jgi:hypothetical protein
MQQAVVVARQAPVMVVVSIVMFTVTERLPDLVTSALLIEIRLSP